jgi:exopolysaccharide production protein ExoZ
MYFKSLQVLRGWAALAVVLYHLGYYADTIGRNPDNFFRLFDVRFSYGGWFFFVVSGFLMTYLIDTGYRLFLPRRLLRIYPSFWLAVIAVTFAKVLIFGTVEIPGLWKVMLLLPFGPSMTCPLGVEWTLIYEVFFYLVCAAFANDQLRHTFRYVLCAWLAVVLIAHLGFDTEQVWFQSGQLFLPLANHLPFSPMNILFIAGGFSYYAYRWLTPRRISWPVLFLFAPPIFILADRQLAHLVFQIPDAYARYADYTLVRLSLLGLCFSLVLISASLREQRRGGGRQGVMERLGDYTYGLYLLHVPTITVILYLAQWKLQRPVADGICAAALAAALLTGWYGGKMDVRLHTHFKRWLGFRNRFATAVELPPAAVDAPARAIARGGLRAGATRPA